MNTEKFKGYAKGALIGSAIVGANIIGLETAHADSPVKETTSSLDDYDRGYITLIITTTATAASLFGYRMSDGARNVERQAWKYVVPGGALAGAGMLLGRVWGVV